MFLYIKTNILRGYGIFKNDFAHSHEPATATLTIKEDHWLLVNRYLFKFSPHLRHLSQINDH